MSVQAEWVFPEKMNVNDVFNVRKFVIDTIGPVMREYAEWYAEMGVSLPEAYAHDPAGWTEVLRKIQRAFYLSEIENATVGEFAEAAMIGNSEERERVIKGYKDEIQTGFFLFGKHLNDLFDKYGPEQNR